MRELNIDWAALHSAFQMNMPEVRCFLSIDDGRVLKLPPGDPLLASVRGETQRYFMVDAIPSRIQYQWLDDFIRSIEDEPIRARMEAAINGKGAFRRFKDILLTLPEERRRWFEYRDLMMRQRIVEWVREQGIVPLNPPPWADEAEGQGNVTSTVAADAETLGNVAYASPGALTGYTGLGGDAVHHARGNNMHYGSPSVSAMPPPPPILTRPQPPHNSPHDVEALRDFLIEWADGRAHGSLSPLELEHLAVEIGKRFHIRAA